jgi:hypothetical protein
MKEKIKNKNIAAIISILLLLLAIPTGIWPYGYYIFLRWVITAIALFIAWIAYDLKKNFWIWLMIGIAILFNPIAPIYLSKETWQVINFIIAALFLVAIFRIRIEMQKKKNEE